MLDGRALYVVCGCEKKTCVCLHILVYTKCELKVHVLKSPCLYLKNWIYYTVVSGMSALLRPYVPLISLSIIGISCVSFCSKKMTGNVSCSQLLKARVEVI